MQPPFARRATFGVPSRGAPKVLPLSGRPIKTASAYSGLRRCENIQATYRMAKMNNWPQVPLLEKHGRQMVLACYGPSLKHTLDELTEDAKSGDLFTVSGAHDFLLDQGIDVRGHIESDPRPHKARFLTRPQADISYMLASACHRDSFVRLRGNDVHVWHVGSTDEEDELIEKLWPGSWTTNGGTQVGASAIAVGTGLGYTEFSIYAMDGSFEVPPELLHQENLSNDELKRVTHHAGVHPNEDQKPYRVWVGDRAFFVSVQMMQLVQDFLVFRNNRSLSMKLHGDGFLKCVVDHIDQGLPLVSPHHRASEARLTLQVNP